MFDLDPRPWEFQTEATIDIELGAQKENILFDGLKYGTSLKVLNHYFD